MTARPWTQSFNTFSTLYEPKEAPAPGFFETVGAAFRMENDVYAAVDIMSKPQHEPELGFDLVDQLKTRQIDRTQWNYYIGVRSTAELYQRQQEVLQNMKDRETLQRAGWTGFVSQIAAGGLSPTLALPFVGTGTKAAQITRAFGYSLLGASMQEAVLLADQPTRTAKEAAFSIGASTVLGGVLGAAVAHADPKAIARLASDMDAAHSAGAIPGLSAARTPLEGGAGKFQYAPGIDLASRIGPITRGIQQADAPKIGGVKYESPVLRAVTSQFGDAGLRMEGAKAGVAAAPGGSIEHLVTTYASYPYQFIKATREGYKDYYFDGVAPALGGVRASVGGTLGVGGKLSRQEFNSEVTKVIWSGKQHEIPQVNAAAVDVQKKVFEPLFKEAQEVGLFKVKYDKEGNALPVDIEKLMGDMGYAMRSFNEEAVRNDKLGFLDIISGRYEEKLQAEFKARWDKMMEKNTNTRQKIEDMQLPAEKAQELLDKFKAQLDETINRQQLDDPLLKPLEDELAKLRSQAALEGDRKKKSAILKKIKEKKAEGGDKLKEALAERRAVSRRIENLTNARALLDIKYQKKLAKVERSERLALNALQRAAGAARKVLNFSADVTPAQLKKGLKDLKNEFETAARVYDKGEEAIVKATAKEPDLQNMLALGEKQEKLSEKMTAVADRIGELEDFSHAAWKKEVSDMLDFILEPYANLIKRRGVREQKLLAQAAELSPEATALRVKQLGGLINKRISRLSEITRKAGGEQFDANAGTAEFKDAARSIAQAVMDKVLHVNGRIPFNDLIREVRGPEYARVLDIPSMDIAKYLETDIEKLAVNYTRTMAADITLMRKFGSTRAEDQLRKLNDEHHAAVESLKNTVGKDGKPLSEAEIAAATKKLDGFYTQGARDIETLLMRVRHERGVPADPTSWASRGSRLALNLNTLRLMGSVFISSIPDIARPIMKFGLLNAYRDGFVPMITQFKLIRMSQKEAQLAGVALDVVLHSRARAISDVFDDLYHGGTKFEKGVEYATTKIGLVALFDGWTSAMKQFTAGLANAKLIRALETVNTGKGSTKEMAKATEYLAAKNLVGEDAINAWKQISGGPGGGQVNGVWLPNTEGWDISKPEVRQALRSYRAALVSEVDDTIVTPGLEKPSIVDQNYLTKMLFQFKSFGMSSTTKTLMAGLQARDMAHVNGTMISLAMGALSYYLWAMSVGGEAKDRMLKLDIEKFADEAISRSGLLGLVDEGQRIGSRIPAISPYLSFSGERSTRREGGDLTEAMLGPSFDMMEKLTGIMTQIDDPTASTAHLGRLLVPFQNHFLLRQGFDAVERSSVHALGLPDRRN